MIRVLGGPKRLCDGLTRRDLLQVGSLGLLGMSLPAWQGGPAANAAENSEPRLARFGQAKACILLFLYGSPSQLETFDPKPDAPTRFAESSAAFRRASAASTFVTGCPGWPS